MKRIALVGPGDINFHFYNLLGLKEKELESELKKIAQALVESEVGIELLPDKGISLEIAKQYKSANGKEVIGTIPTDDKTFGVTHLEEYKNLKQNGVNLFDRFINTGDWFKQDMTKGLFGDAVLYLGSSPGTDLETNAAIYLYKLFKGFKSGVSVMQQKVHPEIRAGQENDFTILIYSPFLKSGRLPLETEAYLEKFEIKYYYIKNAKELKQKINSLH